MRIDAFLCQLLGDDEAEQGIGQPLSRAKVKSSVAPDRRRAKAMSAFGSWQCRLSGRKWHKAVMLKKSPDICLCLMRLHSRRGNSAFRRSIFDRAPEMFGDGRMDVISNLSVRAAIHSGTCQLAGSDLAIIPGKNDQRKMPAKKPALPIPISRLR